MQLMRQVILMVMVYGVTMMIVMITTVVVMKTTIKAITLLRIKIEEEQGMEATSDSCKVEQIQCRSKLQ